MAAPGLSFRVQRGTMTPLLLGLVTAQSLVNSLLLLVVVGLIFWLLWWLVGFVGLPEPFKKVVTVILAIVAVLFLINFLLSLVGTPLIRW